MISALRLISLLALATSLPLSQCKSLVHFKQPDKHSTWSPGEAVVKWSHAKHHEFDPATLYLTVVDVPGWDNRPEWVLASGVDVSSDNADIQIPSQAASGTYVMRLANDAFDAKSDEFAIQS